MGKDVMKLNVVITDSSTGHQYVQTETAFSTGSGSSSYSGLDDSVMAFSDPLWDEPVEKPQPDQDIKDYFGAAALAGFDFEDQKRRKEQIFNERLKAKYPSLNIEITELDASEERRGYASAQPVQMSEAEQLAAQEEFQRHEEELRNNSNVEMVQKMRAGYHRANYEMPIFTDDKGQVIEYGSREWSDEEKAKSYSETVHPERFKPLHDVTAGLIDYLSENFDVEVEEGKYLVEDLYPSCGMSAEKLERVVRLTPADHMGSPITFCFTDFPGILIYSGLVTEGYYPSCGCDGCDDNVEYLVEAIEDTVFAVVAGNLTEKATESQSGHKLTKVDANGNVSGGSGSSGGYYQEKPSQEIIDTLRDGYQWPAWTLN